MSYKVEVIADSSGEWVANALRFPTKEMAEEYGSDLSMRWTAVREWRAVKSKDPVMYYDKSGKQIGPEGPALGISSRRRYMTAAQEKAEDKQEDIPLAQNFSEGDKVTVDRSWKRHWTFREAPAPTKSLWVKLIDQVGVVHGIDTWGNVYVMDSFDQFHGGGGFPVPARFVRKKSEEIAMGAADSEAAPLRLYTYVRKDLLPGITREGLPPGTHLTHPKNLVFLIEEVKHGSVYEHVHLTVNMAMHGDDISPESNLAPLGNAVMLEVDVTGLGSHLAVDRLWADYLAKQGRHISKMWDLARTAKFAGFMNVIETIPPDRVTALGHLRPDAWDVDVDFDLPPHEVFKRLLVR